MRHDAMLHRDCDRLALQAKDTINPQQAHTATTNYRLALYNRNVAVASSDVFEMCPCALVSLLWYPSYHEHCSLASTAGGAGF